MIKKTLITLAILLLSLLLQISAYAKVKYDPDADTSKVTFNDVEVSNWAKAAIYKLAAQETKIFNGYPNGSFKPQRAMSRAEFVKALISSLGIKPVEISYYSDVSPKHWASKYIGTAQAKGIIEPGDYGKAFMPEGEITRYEACKMIVNSFPKSKAIVDNSSIFLKVNYSDVQSFDPKSKRMINLMTTSGILKGYPDNTVKMGATASRAELAAFILRFIENSEKLENAEFDIKDIVKDEYRDGIKVVGLSQLPSKMVRRQNWGDQSALDVQTTINKVTFFKYDSSYKGEYKDLLDKASTLRHFKDFPERKLNNANIIIIEATTLNNSGYTIPESGSYFEIAFAEEPINIIDEMDDYKVNRNLENKDGTAIWLSADKGKNIHKFTTFFIVDKISESYIKITKEWLAYYDPIKKGEADHKSNYQAIGIDLTK